MLLIPHSLDAAFMLEFNWLCNAGASTGSGEALGLPNQKLEVKKIPIAEPYTTPHSVSGPTRRLSKIVFVSVQV